MNEITLSSLILFTPPFSRTFRVRTPHSDVDKVKKPLINTEHKKSGLQKLNGCHENFVHARRQTARIG